MTSESSRLRPAILIISDTAFKDPATEKAGNILRETLELEGCDRWGEPLVEIVPDDAGKIECAIRKWTDDEDRGVDLVVTTGGTGFAVKDITPEVGRRRWIDSAHLAFRSTTWLTRENRPLPL
jgi:gephyrin